MKGRKFKKITAFLLTLAMVIGCGLSIPKEGGDAKAEAVLTDITSLSYNITATGDVTFKVQDSAWTEHVINITSGTNDYPISTAASIKNLGYGDKSGNAITINSIKVNDTYTIPVNVTLANATDDDNNLPNVWGTFENYEIVYSGTDAHIVWLSDQTFVLYVGPASDINPVEETNNSDAAPGEGEVQLGLYFGAGDAMVKKNVKTNGDITFSWTGRTTQSAWGTMYFKQTDTTAKLFDTADVVIKSIKINGADVTVPTPYQTASSALSDDGILDLSFYNQYFDAEEMNKNIGDGTGTDYSGVNITSMEIVLQFSNVKVKEKAEEIVTTTEATTEATTTEEVTTETVDENKGTKIVTLKKTVASGTAKMADLGGPAEGYQFTRKSLLGDIPLEDVTKVVLYTKKNANSNGYQAVWCYTPEGGSWSKIETTDKNPSVDITAAIKSTEEYGLQCWWSTCDYSIIVYYNAEVPLDYVPETADNAPVAMIMVVMMVACASVMIITSRKKKFF